jgi:glutathione synthase/RimK-type ligase-like ATP-grasp enzyme
MLLLVTNRDDLTADWLILELQRRGAAYVRFNTEDYPQRWTLRWRVESASLAVDHRELPAETIHAVWFRRPVAPRVRPGLPADEAAWITREAAEALDGFWRTLDARWVSRPCAIREAGSKPRQLVDAANLGFEIPDTEITSDCGIVRALLDRSAAGVICKPLRDGRVRQAGRSLLFTSPIGAEHLRLLRDEPHLFQALVPKRYDVRVTVIGDRVMATRIESQGDPGAHVDWRRGNQNSMRYSVERLPDDLADRCRRLLRGYGLAFGAIDLARRPDGGYTFFELNPNGQWAFVEQRTGQPLRKHLADLLLGAA